MPAIAEVMEIAPPDVELSWERREWPSPDGAWLAVYHSPRETHTGASGWAISLLDASGKIDKTPRSLRNLSSGKGLLCPSDFLPWRFDSRVLTVLPWDGAPRLFDVESGAVTYCEVTGTPLTMQWAATNPYLLAAYFGRINLLDGRGKQVSVVGWDPADDEIPYTGWTHGDSTFFVLRHSSRQAKTKIAFFDPEKPSAPTRALELDPAQLLPYDATQCRRPSRDVCSLIIGEQRATGHLLHTWQQIKFDPTQNTLLLSIYRPVCEPAQSRGFTVYSDECVCRAVEKWISVRLDVS